MVFPPALRRLAYDSSLPAIRDSQSLPARYTRVGYVDHSALTEKAAADLAIARDWKPGTLQDSVKRGGTETGFRK